MEKKNRIGWSWPGAKAIWATSPERLSGCHWKAARRLRSGRTIFPTCLGSSNGDDVHTPTNRPRCPVGDRFGAVHRLVPGRARPGTSLPESVGRLSRHALRWLDLRCLVSVALGRVARRHQRLRSTGDAPSGISHDLRRLAGSRETPAGARHAVRVPESRDRALDLLFRLRCEPT